MAYATFIQSTYPADSKTTERTESESGPDCGDGPRETGSAGAGAWAAGQGLLVDGIKLYAFLSELSKLMEEAIAVDTPPDGRPEYHPCAASPNSFF